MRVFVCLKVSGETHRVLWLSESKSGIYVGVFNDTVDLHFSYHQDGTRHSRIAKEHHQRWKDVPLHLHSGVRQMLHNSISLKSLQAHRWPTHAPTTRDETILLDESQFVGNDSLAVDVWLADSASEQELRHSAQTAHLRAGFLAVSSSIWELDNFANLRLAISFWAATTSAPSSSGPGVEA